MAGRKNTPKAQGKQYIVNTKDRKGCYHKGQRFYNGDVVTLYPGDELPSYFDAVPEAVTPKQAKAKQDAENLATDAKPGPGNRQPSGQARGKKANKGDATGADAPH